MNDTIETLRARVAELEALCVRLEYECTGYADDIRYKYVDRAELAAKGQQLAAQALTIKTMREALEYASIGSCSCVTKTPDPEFHSTLCKYRIIQKALALPDDSTEVLQEWLDKQLGESVTWYDGETFYANEESASMCCADMDNLIPLYRKPETKK